MSKIAALQRQAITLAIAADRVYLSSGDAHVARFLSHRARRLDRAAELGRRERRLAKARAGR